MTAHDKSNGNPSINRRLNDDRVNVDAKIRNFHGVQKGQTDVDVGTCDEGHVNSDAASADVGHCDGATTGGTFLDNNCGINIKKGSDAAAVDISNGEDSDTLQSAVRHGGDDDDGDDGDQSCNSADEALLEMLGLTSMKNIHMDSEFVDDGDYSNCRHVNRRDNDSASSSDFMDSPSIPSSQPPLSPFVPHLSDDDIRQIISNVLPTSLSSSSDLQPDLHPKAPPSVFQFPRECSVSATFMRRISDELIWSSSSVSNGERMCTTINYHSDKTYETIQVMKRKKKTKSASENDDFGATQMNEFGERYDDDSVEIEIEDRRVLTRMERFVDTHPGWSSLCHDYLRRLLSALVGEEMVLYKEKLNLKPPGGAGFAPHLDTPSLRVASPTGPRNFWTVMVAIDNMTVDNGCLRVVHGHWDEGNCVPYNQPQDNITDSRRILNPDGDGRAGAVPVEDLEKLQLKFEDIVCKGGTVVAFNGWVPHRSSPNTSPFPRRAVFLTYNPKSEGDYHQLYYEQMDRLREAWRSKMGRQNKQKQDDDSELESQWLSTI